MRRAASDDGTYLAGKGREVNIDCYHVDSFSQSAAEILAAHVDEVEKHHIESEKEKEITAALKELVKVLCMHVVRFSLCLHMLSDFITVKYDRQRRK